MPPIIHADNLAFFPAAQVWGSHGMTYVEDLALLMILGCGLFVFAVRGPNKQP